MMIAKWFAKREDGKMMIDLHSLPLSCMFIYATREKTASYRI
jgi:hypothetical protein